MAEREPYEKNPLDWVVIAQAEGVVSARERVGITEAAELLRGRARARGLSIEHVARDLMDSMQSRAGGDS